MFFFKRGKIYHIEYYDGNQKKVRRISTGQKTKEGALQFVSGLKKSLKQKNNVSAPTVNEFYNDYKNYIGKSHSKSYLRSIDLSFKMFIEFIDNPKIDTITVIELEQFFALTFRRAKYAAHLYHRTLKAAFNKAIQWGYLKSNPFSKIKLPKNQKKLPTFITVSEFHTIIDKTNNEMLKHLFTVGYNTGMRLSELTNLQWESIDLFNKFITVQNTFEFSTKSKKDRIIPMNKITEVSLQSLLGFSKSKYVFVNQIGIKFNEDYVSKQFKRIIKKLGIRNDIKFHTLRHSFASNLAQRGVRLYIIKELLGHEDISTTQIYAHLDNSTLVNAVNLL
jgi:site-specific recombinase XerD